MEVPNNRLVLVVLSISCVGMIGLTTIKDGQSRPLRTAVGYLLMPMQTDINRVGSTVYTNFKNQERMRTALSDSESLRKQVAPLIMESTRLQSDSYELRCLRTLYELSQTYGQYCMMGARVIAKDTGSWSRVFRIDKGTRGDIEPDMNVVGDGGLVGIVTDVGDNYTMVRSVVDDVSRTGAMAIQSNDTCVVSGSPQFYASSKLKLNDITDTTDIKDGDAIVTSTTSSRFLPGILIGYVGDLKTDPDRLTWSDTLVPVANFETIQDVLVVLDLKSEVQEDGSFETPRTTLPDADSLTTPETTASEGSDASEADTAAEESTAEGATAESSIIETNVVENNAATPGTSTAATETTARSTMAAARTTATTQREMTAVRRQTERQTGARETRRQEIEASTERRRQETEAPRRRTQAAQPPETQATQTEPTQTVESPPKNP